MKRFPKPVYHTIILSVCLGALFTSNIFAQTKEIQLWTYYTFGPFVTSRENNSVKQGLILDLAKLLEKRSNGKYRFMLSVFPRKRLYEYISRGQQAMVLFVNPAWMQDKAKTKCLWTSKILTDRNEIVSRISGKDPKQIIYNNVESLKGMVLGGVIGRRYKGIDDAVKNGEIERIDVVGEDQNLKKLLAGRIDFITAPESMLKYLIQELNLEGQLYFSPNPLFTYTRHFMVTRDLKDLYEFMENFTKKAGFLRYFIHG